jgi:hypothetical protein
VTWRTGAWLACLLALPTVGSAGDSTDDSTEDTQPACLERVAARLPAIPHTTRIRGGRIGSKRLWFRRGGVRLAIDFAVLDASTRKFLQENGPERFPEEQRLLRRFARALRAKDEVEADALVRGARERGRLDFRLAEVLEQGAFTISPIEPRKPTRQARRPTAKGIFRLQYSLRCGDLCGEGGRAFVTDSCRELVAVVDWES